MNEHHIDLKEVEKDMLGSADEQSVPPPKDSWQLKQGRWCGWLFACTFPRVLLPHQQPITCKEKYEIKREWSQHISEAEAPVTEMWIVSQYEYCVTVNAFQFYFISLLYIYIRFEVFTAVTMTNAVVWDVALSSFCVNHHFGGSYHLHLQGTRICERGTSMSK
jgi:hypothetical protein